MTIGSLLYFGAIALWSAFIAYAVLERIPRKTKKNGAHEEPLLTAVVPSPLPTATDHERVAVPAVYAGPQMPPGTTGSFDPSVGFKSFQSGTELTVDDIVRGLSKG